MRGINQDNPKQARVFYDLFEAYKYGERRHPQIVMKELAERHGFRILGKVPQTLFDGWDYWIEFETPPDLPPIFRDVPWKGIGEA
jgi:hypothetical protein